MNRFQIIAGSLYGIELLVFVLIWQYLGIDEAMFFSIGGVVATTIIFILRELRLRALYQEWNEKAEELKQWKGGEE